jgi:arabinose-5-phosphate isomerase
MFAQDFDGLVCAANWVLAARGTASSIIFAPFGNLTGTGSNHGVFTDGDLRRQLAAETCEGAALARPLAEVMTRHPVCVRDDALAVEALKIFNQRNIDDLIVVNARHQPVGIIDLQDLPKLKLV